ncbi:MAG: YggT family protein [Xylophilus ampelinus]
MLYSIVSLVLNVVASLLAGACLLRLYMQAQRVPFGNPVGQAVFALSNWIVLPLRRAIRPGNRWDLASLLAAFLVMLAQELILWAFRGMAGAALLVPLLAAFDLLQLAVSGMTFLLLAYVVLSWVQPHSPIAGVLDRLCEPPLRPLRRVLPAPGGLDLSALVVLVLLQVLSIVIGGLQAQMVRAVLLG